MLNSTAQILISGWSLGITGIGVPVGAAVIGLLTVWGLFGLANKEARLNQLVLAGWFALPLIGVITCPAACRHMPIGNRPF